MPGPGQAGKTTLVRGVAAKRKVRYQTMDDALTLLSAREDPIGMVRSLETAVIENGAGQLVGVEVKAAATVNSSDLKGLRKLASLPGEQFQMGMVLYDGTETMPLGDRIWAAPLSSLWGEPVR